MVFTKNLNKARYIMFNILKKALQCTIAVSILSTFNYASDDLDRNSKFLNDSFMPNGFDRAKALEEGKRNRFERRDSVTKFRKLDPKGKLPDQPKIEGDSSKIMNGILTSLVKKARHVCSVAYSEVRTSNKASEVLEKRFDSERLTFERRPDGDVYIMLDKEKKDNYFIQLEGTICNALQRQLIRYNNSETKEEHNAAEVSKKVSLMSHFAPFFIPELAKFTAEAEVMLIQDGIDVDNYRDRED